MAIEVAFVEKFPNWKNLLSNLVDPPISGGPIFFLNRSSTWPNPFTIFIHGVGFQWVAGGILKPFNVTGIVAIDGLKFLREFPSVLVIGEEPIEVGIGKSPHALLERCSLPVGLLSVFESSKSPQEDSTSSGHHFSCHGINNNIFHKVDQWAKLLENITLILGVQDG